MSVQPERHSVNPEIITKANAKASGLKRFFTGLPCRKGHLAERHVSSDECVVCRKAQKDREYAKHRDANVARRKAYYAAHKKEWREYAILRRDHINEVRRARDRTKANETGKKWRDKNRQKCRDAKRAEYWEKRAKIRKYQAAYYRRNPQPFKDRARKWGRQNPDKISVSRHRRRALVRNAPGSHTREEIAALYIAQHGRCAICLKGLRRKYHVDHRVALARGGSNDISNIQLTCALCNTKKGAKDPLDFARELGRLL